MKTLILALALTSLSSFASEFTKIDQGTVEWTVTSKTELNVSIYRTSVELMMENLNPSQMQRLGMTDLTSLSALGKIGGYYSSSSEYQDDRSSEVVSKEVSSLINRKMDALRINFRITSSEIELFDLNCKQSGLFRKKLNCSAHYKNISVIELLD